MRHFEPYALQHIALHESQEWLLPQSNSLVFFWWHNKALAHIWIEPKKEKITLDAFYHKLIEALKPAMVQAFEVNGLVYSNNWETYITNNQFTELQQLCSQLFATTNEMVTNEAVSVVVCTRNRTHALPACLDALLQSISPQDEIVVVDNAPSDNGTEILMQLYPSVRYLQEPRKGLDIARNTGAMAAKNSIVAYTDDDVRVSSNWVAAIRNAFQHPMTMAVTGLVIPEALDTATQYIFERYWGFNRGYCRKTFDHAYFLQHLDYGVPVWDIGAGANMAFRKLVFDLIGYFDERLDVGAAGCSGDSEFWYRILAEGWNCYYTPDAYVYHQHRADKASLKNQLFHYMRGQVASLCIQHEKYGHEGNIKRVKKGLPQYYYYRFKHRLLHGYSENFSGIVNEIKGCISGWRFYKNNPPKNNPPILHLPDKLLQPVVVTTATKVSIIITAYNYGRFVKQAIESALQQTYANTEVIVVNDGSTDDTTNILQQYPDIITVNTHRVGVSTARNIGVQYACGNFVLFLDADDYLPKNAVDIQLNCFKQAPLSAYVSGAHQRVDMDGNYLETAPALYKYENIYWSLLQGNYIGMEAPILYRKDLFFTFHFNPLLEACEDYDINIRIARYLPCLSHTDMVAFYRIHGSNMSSKKETMLASALQVLQQQQSFIQNEAEQQALTEGLQNWTAYYQL